ncbi:acyl-CoA thioesterase [Bacillus sp. FJAT-44742]|uniref:acyl-CoA thioesterase n=1 Tax=Bacillus sp. FJAT-44742 TaxID=2014005 RepID=UPI001E5BD3F6|nr:thioesterase family protein [Bacillus sp. FJAT-44742]
MLSDYYFSHPIRVRYSEIDGQKIVFNAHYSTYIDVAVTEYFRTVISPDWMQLAEENVFDLVVRKMTLEFLSPAKLDDMLQVHCRVKKIGTSSMTFEYVITRDEEVLVQAESIQVCFDSTAGKAKAIPKEVVDKISSFEGTALSVK